MHSGIRLAAAALAIALATSVAVGAAGAHEAKAPRTLLTTRAPIRAFAQNTSRIAWVGRGWHVDVRALTGRKKILVLGSARPFPFQGNTFQALPPHVALAGARVLWTKSGGGNDLEGGVFIRKAGDRHRARLLFVTSVDREGREGSYFGAMAGAGSTLIFTSADYECVDAGDCTELAAQPGSNSTGTFRVTGTSGSARLAAAPGAIELALSGSRIALLPRSPRSPRHRSLIPARRPSPRPTRRSISAMR